MKSWSKFGLKIKIFLKVVGSSLNEAMVKMRQFEYSVVEELVSNLKKADTKDV